MHLPHFPSHLGRGPERKAGSRPASLTPPKLSLEDKDRIKERFIKHGDLSPGIPRDAVHIVTDNHGTGKALQFDARFFEEPETNTHGETVVDHSPGMIFSSNTRST